MSAIVVPLRCPLIVPAVRRPPAENKTFAMEHLTLLLEHHDTITAPDHPGFNNFLQKYYNHLEKHGIVQQPPQAEETAEPDTTDPEQQQDDAQSNATDASDEESASDEELEEEDTGRRQGQKIIAMLQHATGLDATALKRLEVRKGSTCHPAIPSLFQSPRTFCDRKCEGSRILRSTVPTGGDGVQKETLQWWISKLKEDM